MESVWLALVGILGASVVTPVVLHILAARTLKSAQDRQDKRLKKIEMSVDGQRTSLMQAAVDGLRREQVLMEAVDSPTEKELAAIQAIKEQIATRQTELDTQMKQVKLAQQQQEEANG